MRNAIILAAGKGTRMKSETSKVMHPIMDRPMVQYIIDALRKANVERIVVVVGYQAEQLENALKGVEFALQEPQNGTGHAVMCAAQLEGEDGDTIVINGDGPCIHPETLEKLFEANKDASATILTSVLEDGKHYGRVLRNEAGDVISITEAKDCTPEQLQVKEINAGMYCFKNEDLFEGLKKLKPNNAQNEYYLTDLAAIFANEGKKVKGLIIEDQDETMGVNDCLELSKAYSYIQKNINENQMKNGVQIADPARAEIGMDVAFGHDVLIEPDVQILGKSYIGSFSRIESGSRIVNSTLGENCLVSKSALENSTLNNEVKVGKYSQIVNSNIGASSRIFNSSVIENSTLGQRNQIDQSRIIDSSLESDEKIGPFQVVNRNIKA